MKKILSTALALFFLSQSFFAQNVYKDYVDGNVYIKITKAALKMLRQEDPTRIPPAKLKGLFEIISKYGTVSLNRPFYQAWEDETLPCILKLEFSKTTMVNQLMDELLTLPYIEYTEKVPLMRIDATPNDPQYSSAAHLTMINAAQAWNVFNGTANGNSTITVAVVDNAVMWTHTDLVASTYTNTGEIPNNNIDDDNNGYKDDINGFDVADNDNNAIPSNSLMVHGTHCAGIAGATTDNNTGVASIGWNIKIIPVKCETDNGGVSNVTYAYEGVIYAAKAKAKIISCSWGSNVNSAIGQAVINFAWNRGSIVIASAGNNNTSTPQYPAAYNNVYCVAATDNSDNKLSISNFGSWVDICAPGDNITSTVPYGTTPAYIPLSGTSMAAPMVAGLAALMMSKSPYMSRQDVLNCISSTAFNVYSVGTNINYSVGSQLGAGRINALAAMNCAASFSASVPVANFYAFPLNTCPNTTIALSDSSLYGPTSWNWTIQGGNPATSTLANPVVQWNSPGTYSISLTVSNASGSSSATKLSYITVAGPAQLPFVEGFQPTQFVPPGWSVNNIANDPIYWERQTGVGGFGTSSACAVFNNYDYPTASERDEMRTPKFNMTNVNIAKLRFDVAYARYSAYFPDSLEVKLSTNCGLTWTSIYLNGGSNLATAPDNTSLFVPTNSQWRTDSVNVSPFVAGQGNVMFSFINRGNYGQIIYLDNINIFTPPPSVSISGPTLLCSGNSATFNSNILGAQSVIWNYPGGTSTVASLPITFTANGTYTLTLTGVNGTSSTSANYVVSVITTPSVAITVSPSGTLCVGNSATLTASGTTTYSWNTGASSNTIVVSPTSTTAYTVTGYASNCSDTKTITVTTVSTAPVLTANASPTTVCSGGNVTLSVSGATTYTWSNGATGPITVVNPTSTSNYFVNGNSGNCSGSTSLTINVLALPLSVLSSTNAGCNNFCSGAVNAVSSGGTSPYTYSLSSGTCTAVPCTSLCAGVYTIYTIDSQGCNTSNIFSISSLPNTLLAGINTTNASCPSVCPDGALGVNVTGGAPPYTYSWTPSGGSAATAQGLTTGCYTVVVNDAGGCLLNASGCVSYMVGLNPIYDASTLLIFPNPAHDNVTIEYGTGNFEATLYNSLGQLIIAQISTTSVLEMNTSHLSKGVYIMEIKQGNSVIRKKLLLD